LVNGVKSFRQELCDTSENFTQEQESQIRCCN